MSPTPSLAPDRLWHAAQQMETQFLSQMLVASGLGDDVGGFGGGIGEEQFASMLVDEQAQALVKGGGLGLTESIYAALKERENAPN